MNEEQKPNNDSLPNVSGGFSFTVTGNDNSAIGQAINSKINQERSTPAASLETMEADLLVLQRMFETLKAQVETEAPPEQKEDALKRVDELQEAVTAKEPDLDTMAYIKKWFVKNLPTLSGAVTSIVVHPIVGKVVEAAGETLAADFRHRFGAN